jgi:hypothetical protein
LAILYRRRTDNTMAKRYQSVNQNLYIEEELTTQWSKYTKGVIRICISKKSRRRPLCRLLFFDILILIIPLVSFGHCVVSSSSIYRFWLTLWYLFAILTTQWPTDTKVVIRISISKKNWQHDGQKIPKG